MSLATKVLSAVETIRLRDSAGGTLAAPAHCSRSRSSTVDICPVVAGLFFNGFTKLVRSSEHLNGSEPAVA